MTIDALYGHRLADNAATHFIIRMPLNRSGIKSRMTWKNITIDNQIDSKGQNRSSTNTSNIFKFPSSMHELEIFFKLFLIFLFRFIRFMYKIITFNGSKDVTTGGDGGWADRQTSKQAVYNQHNQTMPDGIWDNFHITLHYTPFDFTYSFTHKYEMEIWNKKKT